MSLEARIQSLEAKDLASISIEDLPEITTITSNTYAPVSANNGALVGKVDLSNIGGSGGDGNNVVIVPNAATVTQADLTDNVTYVLQDFSQDTTINLEHNPAANKSLTATFYITGQDGWEYTFTDSTATIHDYLNGGLITSISFFAEEVYKIEVKTVNTGTQIIRYVTAGVAY